MLVRVEWLSLDIGSRGWMNEVRSGAVSRYDGGPALLRNWFHLLPNPARMEGFTYAQGRHHLLGAALGRPPLSKGLLAGAAATESITLLTRLQAADLGINLLLGRAARHLDVARSLIELADGERLRYDDLVVATGARPRPSPWVKPAGVHYLRTLGDAAALRDDLARGGPLVIIGAGFIGAEVAATARQLGVREVTLIDPAPVPMGRVIDPVTAARLGALHREHGVDTRFGTGIEAIEPAADDLVVRLSDGSALAPRPSSSESGPLPTTSGWPPRACLWGAACAARNDVGRRGRRGCTRSATSPAGTTRGTARLSGSSTGRTRWTRPGTPRPTSCAPASRVPYQPVEYVWSDQYYAKIQVTGRTGADPRSVTLERAGQPGSFAVLYASPAGTLAGAVTVSWPRAAVAAGRAIKPAARWTRYRRPSPASPPLRSPGSRVRERLLTCTLLRQAALWHGNVYANLYVGQHTWPLWEKTGANMRQRSDARRRMVQAARQLIRERGYHATAISDVLERSGAPRGSVYFHFPEGKAQLAVEAAEDHAHEQVTIIDEAAEQADSARRLIEIYVDLARDGMVSSGYSRGCGIAPLVTEAGPEESEEIADTSRRAFTAIIDRLAFHLVDLGLERAPARQLADAAIAGVEGALVTARALRSPAPFESVLAALGSHAGTVTPKSASRKGS